MENKLLEEINRFRKISGLPSLDEQGTWLAQLSKKGIKRISSMDQLIKNLGYSGRDLTDNEIDDLIDQLKKQIEIPSEILEKFKNELKTNASLKKSLTNFNDNFVDVLQKSKKSAQAAFQRINYLTKEQVRNIIDDVVSTFLNKTDNYVYQFYDSFDTQISNLLEGLYLKNITIRNEEDMWNIVDALINDNLIARGLDDAELADALFQKLKEKYRTKSKIKDSIDKFKTNNKLSKEVSDVPTTPKFSTTKVADSYKNTKSWVKETTDTLPDVVDNLPTNKIDDGSKLPTTLDEANEVLARYEETPTNPNPPDPVPNNTPDPVFFNNFFYKYCKTGLCEAVLNLLSALVMSPQKLADDTIFTQQRIIDLSQQLERMNPGDKNLFKVKFELDGWVNRLKRNINLAKDAENGFLTTWETMKAQIRATAGTETGNRVIQYCETNAITSQGETLTRANPIKNFTDLLFKHTDEGQSTDFYDIRKVLTPEFWATLKNTSAGRKYDEYAALVKSADEKLTKTGFIGVIYKMAKDFISEAFKRTINILTFGTFRNYKDIISSLTKGRFMSRTGLTIKGRTFYGLPAIQRWFLLYVEMMLISNIVMPFLEFAKETLFGLYEGFGFGDIKNESGLTPWEQFKKDIVDRIPIIGEEFDWNPFLNPIGFIPGVKEVGQTLGFEPAPLPKFIAEKIGKMLGIVGDAADNDRSINIAEENRIENEEEFLRILNDILNAREKRKIEEYNNNPAKQKETQNETEKMKENFVRYNTFESLKTSHPEHYIEDLNLISKLQNSLVYFNELRPSVKRAILIQEVLKPKNVLKDNKVVGTFNPNQKIKFVPNQTGIDLGYKTDNEPPIGTEIQELDIKKFNPNTIDSDFGYWALKGKDNKYYEVSKDDWGNGTFYSFKTPDVKTMLENLNVETKLHPLKDFANYL